MRGLCRNHNEVRKVHEDFEFADEIICWECGNKIIELVGQNFMRRQVFILRFQSVR